MAAPLGMRSYFVAYGYSWRPNTSCDACNWLSLGLYETRVEASAAASAYAERTGEPTKVGTTFDY